MAYHIRFSAVSHTGLRRKENQDNFVCNGRVMDKGKGASLLICGKTKVHSGAVFGIFDGMGGGQCGEMASRIAAQNALDICIKKSVAKGMTAYCSKTERDICTYREEKSLHNTGTTAATMVFAPGKIGLCNIGDSKVYRISNHKMEQISADHSICCANGKRYLTQNFGMCKKGPSLTPYVAQGTYQRGDRYLICSDGLTDMVSEGMILGIAGERQLENAVSALLNAALENGGKDNITVILCEVEYHWFR